MREQDDFPLYKPETFAREIGLLVVKLVVLAVIGVSLCAVIFGGSP